MALLTSFRRFAATFALLAFFVPSATQADNNLQLHAQEIEAGLLYNFLKYVDWPSASMARSSAITVCIFGEDPFDGYLRPMAGRTVNQREIAVRSIHDPQDANSCHLLFVSSGERDRWPQLQRVLANKSILTVSDFDDFSATGGMIEFGLKDNHIIVLLNLDATTAAQLRVEDRLLKLVTVVHPAAPREP